MQIHVYTQHLGPTHDTSPKVAVLGRLGACGVGILVVVILAHPQRQAQRTVARETAAQLLARELAVVVDVDGVEDRADRRLRVGGLLEMRLYIYASQSR